ncbi:MAG: glycosyltransferase [Actinomycetota bacterium]
MTRKAVIAVISDLSTDMRVRKLALVMAEEGYSVTITGRHSGTLFQSALQGVKMERIRVPFRRGPAMYIAFNILLFFRLLFRRFEICVASDLDTLVPCWIVSRIFGKTLVYDSHEYFTGQHGLRQRWFKHFLWKCVEGFIVPKVRYMITVSDSIADLYRKEYGADPVVVRNVSPEVSHLKPHDRSKLRVPADVLLVVYQGSGINPGRGAEELLEALAMTKGVWLLVIGSGDAMENLRIIAWKSPASDRIIFLPRMPWEEMMRYTLCCDAGLSLDTDTCINQRYSLPNKLFDYIAAGIPVLASPLPEVSALVEAYGCGMVLGEVTPEDIAVRLQKLADERSLLLSLKEKAEEARRELTWEKEKVKEQELIRSVIKSNSKG